MLHPQPGGKTGADNESGRRDARVPHEEILHCRQLSQPLSYRDADDGEHKTEWQRPQHVYPTPANPDLGHHANLRRQPIVQEDAVVRRAEIRRDGIMRERNALSTRHTVQFFGKRSCFDIAPRRSEYSKLLKTANGPNEARSPNTSPATPISAATAKQQH
jgi:hypothetical protein